MKKFLCVLLVVLMCLMSASVGGFDLTAEAADYKVGDIIQFGSYPQSKVTDSATITALNNRAPAWDNWTSYGYYSGTGSYGTMKQGDWMRYVDIKHDGNKYRGVKFTQHRRYYTYSSSSNSTYQDDNGYSTNTVYWFKFENIDWRVLDPITGLVMCETIIDSQPYSNTIYYNSSVSDFFNDASYKNYSSDYETSSIRQWLNNDFYNTAFTDSEKKEISTTTLNNDGYYTSKGTIGYENLDSNETKDKIFLLSYNEVRNSNFGFNSSSSAYDAARFGKGSDYAQSQGLYVFRGSGSTYNGNSYWRLRSPGGNSDCCCHVDNHGHSGSYYYVYDTSFGVCPAMCIGLEDASNNKIFPKGYNFEEDSYNFVNYDSIIPYGYFKTMYNDGKAWALFTKKWLQGGVCFGMTYTTASLYNGFPSVNTIRTLSDDSIISIGNYDLTLEAFIDYAHIYQFSNEFSNGTVWTDGTTIYNLVEGYLRNDKIGVTIGMTRKDKSGGHRVLAVGIDGNDILIDDPNNKDDYERLTVNSDGTWSFSGLTDWNSDTCFIRYNLDYFEPYKFIKSMNPLNVNNAFIDNFTIDKVSQNSISEYLSSNSILLSINCDEYYLENSNTTKLEFDYSNGSNSTDTQELYWIDENKTVTISNVDADESEFEVAGNENIVKLKLDVSPQISVTIDEENNTVKTRVDTIKGTDYEIDNISFDDASNPVSLNISCISKSDVITTRQTETGLTVTGIEDGTITLSKNDEVISTQIITNAESDIEITYDKNGETDSLEVEYEAHEHTYNSVVTKEATCTENGVKTFTCECNDQYTEAIGANGHTDSEWIVDKDSNCSAEGSKHIECTVCEEVLKTESIAKLPHKYNTVVTKPTCKTGGYTTYTCTCGNTYTGDKTSAKGHDYVKGICKNCGDSKIDNCSCNCHAGGIKGFFFKFLLFFQKIFRTNKVCKCGINHY